jgi:phosphoribosyl 1,2-cyclic phosphate phosphodiesterase
MLASRVTEISAILLTHEHNDHVIGLDDVRPFNFMQWRDMPVYGTRQVLDEVKLRFEYVFRKEDKYPGAPMIGLIEMDGVTPFFIEGISVIPIRVMHGKMPVLGFRFGDFTYITDAKTIDNQELEKVMGTKVLVLNALHHQWHHSHLNLEEALSWIEKIRPEKAFLTHMSHHMGLHEEVSKHLPEGVFLAYDGMVVTV